MKAVLDESQPIFQQIAQMIMDEIVDGNLKEEEKIPSENDLSGFYNINRATVRKGFQHLVDDNILYKQRGIGMFVKKGAKQKLLKKREQQFKDEYIRPMLKEAKRIGVDAAEVIKMIEKEEPE